MFKDVTIKNADPTSNPVVVEDAAFLGLYANLHVEDGEYFFSKGLTVLFLQNDKIYYINEKGATINAFRAFFGINLDVSELPSEARILIDWGDDEEATGIASMEDGRSLMEDVWYDLSGRKLEGKPSVKGIYMYNGTKVAVQ